MPYTPFVLNDETKKNSHGFYLVNAGGRLERFNDNPVMLDHHNLEKLIGKWHNPRVDGSKLIADADFDEGTPLGAERKGQVERGYLKGASPGILPLVAEYRDDLVTGGVDLFVTEWELIEGSVASVPSNAGALTLKIYGQDQQPIPDEQVKLHLDKIVKLSAESKAPDITNKIKRMEKITLTAEAFVALGISENADSTAISAAIVKLQKDNAASTAEVERLKTEAKTQAQAAAAEMVELAIREGRITADKKEVFLSLATENPVLAKQTIEALPKKVSLSAQISGIQTDAVIPTDRKGWTHLQWLKEDPQGLERIKADHPEAFEEIKKVRK